MSNCLFEATLQKIERDCGCTPKNFVAVANGTETNENTIPVSPRETLSEFFESQEHHFRSARAKARSA